jgi:hypothetical protein
MATVKRAGTDKKTSASKAEFTDALTAKEGNPKGGGAKARKSVLDNDRKSLEDLYEQMGKTVYVHNTSGTEFHVRPVSDDTKDHNSAVVFQVNQVIAFAKAQVDNDRFRAALMENFLKIVSEEEVDKIEKEAEKAKHHSGKAKVGITDSGLPVNKRAALNYIFDCEDIDELEAYQELEDREFISDAIEQRIEELEGGDSE